MDVSVAISAVGLFSSLFITPHFYGPNAQKLEGQKACDLGALQVVLKDEKTLLVKYGETVLLFKPVESFKDMQRFTSPSGKFSYIQTTEKSYLVDNYNYRTVLNECKTVKM